MNTNKAALKSKVIEQLESFVEVVIKDNGSLDKLMASGAIDFSETEEGYMTAHKIMCALGREMENQHNHNLSAADKKEIKNFYAMM